MKRSGAGSFQDFYQLLQTVHQIPRVDVLLGYTDIHGDLLPINNDDNYHKALSSANPLLRVIIQKKGKQGIGCILLSREMSHIPYYFWFHLWTGMAGHMPSSHCFGGWMWRWVALGGCQNPARAVAPTCLSPAPCNLMSKGRSLQFTPLKLCFPAKLLWALR